MSEEMFSDNISENSDQDPVEMETHTTTATESHTEPTDSEPVDQLESEDYESQEPTEESVTLQSDSLDNTEKKDERNNKLIKFPIARMKVIMKTDPSVNLVNRDAVLSTAKAAELFVEYLTLQAYSYTLLGKRKTITMMDVESAILNEEKLSFLEGALDF